MNIDVYWDATVSMQGFTKLVSGNGYRSIPDMPSELGSFLGEVRFFRFGEEVTLLERRDYRRFSDADWSNVTQKFREKYFSQHLAVAIIGVKNSFYGEIYDVWLNVASFGYNSGDDPARYRPFYLFLMGSEPQVRTFLESWKAKMPSEEIKCVVFSEYFATYTPDMKNTTKLNLVGDRKLMKADARLQEMRVAERDK